MLLLLLLLLLMMMMMPALSVRRRRAEVAIEVSAALSPAQWLAVGFSERGELPGADLCVLWVDWRRHVRLQVGSYFFNFKTAN